MPDDERDVHRASVLLPTGAAHSLDVFTLPTDRGDRNTTMLLVSSLTHGAILYEFDIPRVIGMSGAARILAEPCGNGVYIAGGAGRSVAWVRRRDETDSYGAVTRKLSWQAAWANDRAEFSRTSFAHTDNIEGLAGVRKMQYRCDADSCDLYVVSQPHRTALPCSVRPLVGIGDQGSPPLCSSPLEDTLEVLQLETTNQKLFEKSPALLIDGTLQFQLAPGVCILFICCVTAQCSFVRCCPSYDVLDFSSC